MARVIKTVTYNTRSISFQGRVVFASMGKYVTDFLGLFRGPNWTITNGTDDEAQADRQSADAQELGCVVDVLDAAGVPTILGQDGTTGADVPYTVHARVQAAIDGARVK